jgi:hypothetical protein
MAAATTVPSGAVWQLDWPVLAWNVPTAHVVHPWKLVDVPPSPDFPAAHAAQCEAPDGAYALPTAASLCGWLPEPHTAHSPVPSLLYFPGTHAKAAEAAEAT